VPRVGGAARIAHFGGELEECTVTAVAQDGRTLQVTDSGGRVLESVLNPATARFLQAGSGQGARLELVQPG
jgi:hypothetical protein